MITLTEEQVKRIIQQYMKNLGTHVDMEAIDIYSTSHMEGELRVDIHHV